MGKLERKCCHRHQQITGKVNNVWWSKKDLKGTAVIFIVARKTEHFGEMLTFLSQSLTNGKYSTFHALCGSDKLNNITYACAHTHAHTHTHTWKHTHTDTRGHAANWQVKPSFAPLIPEANNWKNCQMFECMIPNLTPSCTYLFFNYLGLPIFERMDIRSRHLQPEYNNHHHVPCHQTTGIMQRSIYVKNKAVYSDGYY